MNILPLTAKQKQLTVCLLPSPQAPKLGLFYLEIKENEFWRAVSKIPHHKKELGNKQDVVSKKTQRKEMHCYPSNCLAGQWPPKQRARRELVKKHLLAAAMTDHLYPPQQQLIMLWQGKETRLQGHGWYPPRVLLAFTGDLESKPGSSSQAIAVGFGRYQPAELSGFGFAGVPLQLQTACGGFREGCFAWKVKRISAFT